MLINYVIFILLQQRIMLHLKTMLQLQFAGLALKARHGVHGYKSINSLSCHFFIKCRAPFPWQRRPRKSTQTYHRFGSPLTPGRGKYHEKKKGGGRYFYSLEHSSSDKFVLVYNVLHNRVNRMTLVNELLMRYASMEFSSPHHGKLHTGFVQLDYSAGKRHCCKSPN